MNISISGTRKTDHQSYQELDKVLNQFLEPFAQEGTRFYLGGAIGMDTVVLSWLWHCADVDISVVVPGRLKQQPVAAIEAIEMVLTKPGNHLFELGLGLNTEGYYARNRYLVDHTDMLIAFPLAATLRTGGTAYTMRYADSLDRPILTVPV